MRTRKRHDPADDDDPDYIYRASITLHNGKRIFAWRYGKRAFKIPIRRQRR
jgi:hypothetical protein